ncbi:hypothetical protein T310_10189 [Rasamsonia emersonii CBS 393.64]|uniref:Uncharacterized protein n=1 Tax=Rasamsonia emersonii (strain ATCC 16479 / CBS 393.64 / IMI 116815) TaxID=1408163 RepID=A0A0F4YDH2_RASE3|nr:hypothetical protein T310_10189 [Rasamsonia emersonii CBS 393.64]KKA16224.1 hypothetical protein T310_10189 [Rasamsonia emersonii CBS 393.64]
MSNQAYYNQQPQYPPQTYGPPPPQGYPPQQGYAPPQGYPPMQYQQPPPPQPKQSTDRGCLGAWYKRLHPITDTYPLRSYHVRGYQTFPWQTVALVASPYITCHDDDMVTAVLEPIPVPIPCICTYLSVYITSLKKRETKSSNINTNNTIYLFTGGPYHTESEREKKKTFLSTSTRQPVHFNQFSLNHIDDERRQHNMPNKPNKALRDQSPLTQTPGDFNQPREDTFRNVLHEDSSDEDRSRDDPHTRVEHKGDGGRKNRTRSFRAQQGQARRKPSTSRSRSRDRVPPSSSWKKTDLGGRYKLQTKK